MVDAKTGALGHVGVAISFGLVIMVMIYARRPHLGGPLQPCGDVRVCGHPSLPAGRASPPTGLRSYAGALAAALVLRGSLGDIAHIGATLPSGSDGQAFLWEAVLTFFLMFVIMAVATDTRAVGEAAAIAIGATVGLDAMFGGPITGASMNPARSLGPAIAAPTSPRSGCTSQRRSLGAALAAVAYQFLRTRTIR